MKNVLMVSTFGPKIRGISPYADQLFKALSKRSDVNIRQADFLKAFPNIILPKGINYAADNECATIHYARPNTWDLLKSTKADILHFQYWSPAFLPVLIACIKRSKKHGCKIIITWHNPSPHESLPIVSRLEKYMASLVDHIICHTENGANILKHNSQSSNVSIIHHGCETNKLEPTTPSDYESVNLDNSFDYFLYFGNIRPYKGVDKLIDAWERIYTQHPNFKLILAGKTWEPKESFISRTMTRLIGSSEYADKIKAKIETSKAPIVADLRFIPNPTLVNYIKISKLAVFPYQHFDSQSGAASMAAGHGLPIITTYVGGLSELTIDSSYVSSGTDAYSIAKIIDSKLDIVTEKLRVQQLSRSRQLSWESSAELHSRVYHERC